MGYWFQDRGGDNLLSPHPATAPSPRLAVRLGSGTGSQPGAREVPDCTWASTTPTPRWALGYPGRTRVVVGVTAPSPASLAPAPADLGDQE